MQVTKANEGRHRHRATAVLFVAAWRSWFNQIARALGARWKAALLLAALLALVIVAVVWSAASVLDSIGGVQLLHEAPAVVVGAVSCLAALGTILAALYTPDRNTLTAHLSPLPIEPAALRRAARTQELLVGLVLAVTLTAPILSQAALSGPPEAAVRGVALLLGLIAVAENLTLVATRLVGLALAAGRIEPAVARALAALAVLAAFAWMFLASLPINFNEPHGPAVWSAAGLVWALDGPQGWVLVGALGAVSGGLWLALGRVDDIEPGRGRDRRVSARRAGAGMVSLERRQWLRFGPNLVMLIFLNGVAVLALAGTGASGNDPLGTAYLILPMLSAVGVGAFGPTRRVLWLYRMTGRPLAWVVPKMLAVCSVWAVVVVGYGAALALLGQWTWHDLAWMLPISLAELLVAMAVGVLLPVTADQSISGSISEAAALVSVIVLAAGFQSALAGVDSLWWALALQVAAIGLAALGYGLVSVRAALR